MRVIAIMDWIESPLANKVKTTIKEGEIYTVKDEHRGYSTFGKRWVDAYEFYEIKGFYEKGIFIPLSDQEETISIKIESEPNCHLQ